MRRGRASRPDPTRSDAPHLLCSLILLVTAVVPAFAGGASEEEALRRRASLRKELSLEEMTYPVVLAAVVAPEATDVDRVALGSWIEVVRDIVAEVETRYIPAEEREALARREIAAYRQELTRREEDRIHALERSRLEGRSTAPGRAEAIRETDAQLAEIAAERALLATFTPESVVVPSEVQIDLLDGAYRFRRVLPSPRGLARRRRRHG
jgi:hypothetical protein